MNARSTILLLAAALLSGLFIPPAAGADPESGAGPGAAVAIATDAPAGVAAAPTAAPAAPTLEERWGVRIEGLRRTSGGYMLDFRYRVTDAGKAAPLFSRRARPYLIDQASGARFQVPNPPKTGPLRTSGQFEQDRVYWMFFANPGRFIRPGGKVTVVIGDFRAEDLTVQ